MVHYLARLLRTTLSRVQSAARDLGWALVGGHLARGRSRAEVRRLTGRLGSMRAAETADAACLVSRTVDRWGARQG